MAQNRLAYLVATGQGVDKNLADARHWRDESRKAGLQDARLDLLLSEKGDGKVPTEPKQ